MEYKSWHGLNPKPTKAPRGQKVQKRRVDLKMREMVTMAFETIFDRVPVSIMDIGKIHAEIEAAILSATLVEQAPEILARYRRT